MRSNIPLLRGLIDQAQAAARSDVFLPKLEPHPASLVVGLGGTALGLWTGRYAPPDWRVELGWAALLMVFVGMLMYLLMQRQGVGWRLDFVRRRVEPVGQDGRSAELEREGWRLLCVAGDKRRSLALEFRHDDGGKPLRVFQSRGNANQQEHRLVSQLADELARRLAVPRDGLSL